MSLINEALRKARQEAAEQEAEERAGGGAKGKAVYREPRAHLPTGSKMGVGLAVGVLLGVLAAGGGGLGVWWLTNRAADSGSESEPKLTSVVAEPAQEVPKQPSSAPQRAPEPTPTEASTPENAPATEPTPPGEAPRPTPVPTAAPARAEPAAARPTAESVQTEPVESESVQTEPVESEAVQPETVQPQTLVASSEPVAMSSEPTDPEGRDLPKLIEPPETIGQVGNTNVFVLEADLGDGKVVLDFIVWNPSSPFAQINGKQVEVGQLVAGLLVESIERDQVTLKATDGRIVLRVR